MKTATLLLAALLLASSSVQGRLLPDEHGSRHSRELIEAEFPDTEFPSVQMRDLSTTEEFCYLGCYADSFDKRALPRFLYKQDQTMSVEDCHGAAILKNRSLFALQFRRECWAGVNLARAISYGPSRDCNETCPGNSAELCGGWLAFNLYSRGPCPAPPSPSPPPPSPPPPSPPPPSVTPDSPSCFVGCYADSFGGRSMEKKLFRHSSAMTVEACRAAAVQKGYQLFGLSYGEECWGSNLINQATLYGQSSGCTFPCSGNASQTCGGNLAVSLYSQGICQPPPPPDFSPRPPPNPSPPAPPPPEPICPLGCYADTYSNRALSTFLYRQSMTMSPETCHLAAIEKGFTFYAVQFGEECWASNDGPATVQFGPSTSCNMTCPGSADTCGGWLAFNLYSRGPCPVR